MAGQIDFLLKINIGSLPEYHEFVKGKLARLDNVGTLNTIFVLKDIKQGHSIVI
jgi:DNA-binding Lrp family transcriptional regulator